MLKKIQISAVTGIIALLSLTEKVFAQNRAPIIPPTTGDKPEALVLPTGNTELSGEVAVGGVFLPGITRTVIAMAGGLALLFVIIGAIQILTAYGDEERVTAGKKSVTYAIVGLLIAILSYTIVSIIGSISLK